MIQRILFTSLASVLPLALLVGCSDSKDPSSRSFDRNGDNVADDLGTTVDRDGDGLADGIDINGDGIIDGPGIDTDGDGIVDALGLDTDCNGTIDSIDVNGDGLPDFVTSLEVPATNVPGCTLNGIGDSGTGGAGTGGAPTTPTGGTGGGMTDTGGTSNTTGGGPSQLGGASYTGTGNTTDQYAESDVYRNGVGYKFIANGWGQGWNSHQISWNGTSFTVKSLTGNQGGDYSPAGYPTMFCGFYSEKQSPGTCGLPAALNTLTTVQTGWRWKSNGSGGQYNAAWDIWLGNGTSLSAYLMVWLRDPSGQQPAGSAASAGATVDGLPGTWNIWTGNVNGRPIVNYVRPEGQDMNELEFDVMKVYRDAIGRGYNLPGSHLMAVAVGYEIWNGPVTNLETEDFYVDVN